MQLGAATSRGFSIPLVLVGMVTLQLSSAFVQDLFDQVGPSGAALLRILISAILLCLIARPKTRLLKQHWRLLLPYGAILGIMQLAFYEAIARLPLGVVVTLEFTGPLIVGLVFSRKARDVIWVVLAGTGIVLLGGIHTLTDPIGVAASLVTAAALAGYILLGSAVSRVTSQLSGLAMAMAIASVVALPIAGFTDLPPAGELLHPTILVAALGVALFATVVPFSLEFAAMRHIPQQVFAVLVTLEPVLAHISRTERTATLVAGSYFESGTGIDEFSVNSFALASRIGAAIRRRYRRNKVLYDVIHNDLGMACGTDACSIAAPTAEPDLGPLKAVGIDFTVTRERTLRNRATRSMKAWLKDPTLDRRFVRDGDDILFRSRSYERVLAGVAKEHHVVPRCPLIVSEYFAGYFARLREFPSATHRYVVDLNTFADRDKILKGAEIYLRSAGSPDETIVVVFVDPACSRLVELSLTQDDY